MINGETNSKSETDLYCHCVIVYTKNQTPTTLTSSLPSFYDIISKKQEWINVKAFRDYILYFEINNFLIILVLIVNKIIT